MDFARIAVLLYVGALVHFVADTLGHRFKKKDNLFLVLLHCFIYSVTFVPYLLFFNINVLWAIIFFLSHFIIEESWNFLDRVTRYFYPVNVKNGGILMITKLMDQILHLTVIAVIVFLSSV